MVTGFIGREIGADALTVRSVAQHDHRNQEAAA